MAALGWLQFLGFAGSAARPPSDALAVHVTDERVLEPLVLSEMSLLEVLGVREEAVA